MNILLILFLSAFEGVLPVGQSDRDTSGNFSMWVEFPEQPVTIYGGSEDKVYRRNYLIQIPPSTITKVKSFIGYDAGDFYEADLELVTREGIRLYQRSPHHDINNNDKDCDAWKTEEVEYTCGDPAGCYIEVILLGRVTDRNASPQNPNFGQLKARLHFGLRLDAKDPTSHD